MFIGKHRRFSQQPGYGVQYIPGHIEPLVDLVLKEFVPPEGDLLDLGGGGLRFALPVALGGRAITVVDLDGSGLDVGVIVDRVNELEGTAHDAEPLTALIDVHEVSIMDFLRANDRKFSLISIFRVAHFFSPEDFADLFRLTYDGLSPGGLFVVSGMTAYNIPDENDLNEIYRCSEALSESEPLVRKFTDRPETLALREEQNLPEYVHLVDSRFIAERARATGYEMVVDGFQSTRIVAGYILRRPKR